MALVSNNCPTNMILDSPGAVRLKHVHESSVAQSFLGDVDIETTYREFTVDVVPPKRELGRRRFRLSYRCPVCDEEVVFSGHQASEALVDDPARRRKLFWYLYRTSLLLGGGILYLLLGFLFVFVLPTGILLGLGLPPWLAVTLGAATYMGLFVYLSVADAREELSRHLVGDHLLVPVTEQDAAAFAHCPIHIRLCELKIRSGYPRHCFRDTATGEYSVVGQGREIDFTTRLLPRQVETEVVSGD